MEQCVPQYDSRSRGIDPVECNRWNHRPSRYRHSMGTRVDYTGKIRGRAAELGRAAGLPFIFSSLHTTYGATDAEARRPVSGARRIRWVGQEPSTSDHDRSRRNGGESRRVRTAAPVVRTGRGGVVSR